MKIAKGILGVPFFAAIGFATTISGTPAFADGNLPDYAKLASECKSGCCRASVQAMSSTKSTLQEPGKPCPPGTIPNMFRCAESHAWCEPARPKAPAMATPTVPPRPGK